MPSALPIADVRQALTQRTFPSITTWNRLEARPRTTSFDRALRVEVRDPLWMLTKQWQMGEFRGSDAGSPVSAKLQIDTTRLTQYRPGTGDVQAFDETLPLEAKVERDGSASTGTSNARNSSKCALVTSNRRPV